MTKNLFVLTLLTFFRMLNMSVKNLRDKKDKGISVSYFLKYPKTLTNVWAGGKGWAGK